MNISAEGLVRVSLEELLSMPITHRYSGIDEHRLNAVSACGRRTTICGYTEWGTSTRLVVSLGWDWRVDVSGGTVRLVRRDSLRTNALLVDSLGQDLTWESSLGCLATVVDSLQWSIIVQAVVADPHGARSGQVLGV